MKQRIVLIITLILTAAIVTSVALILMGFNSDEPITLEEAEKIQVGMTEEEVLSILGYNGKCAASGSDRREWEIENGQYLNFLFVNKAPVNENDLRVVCEVQILDYSNAIE